MMPSFPPFVATDFPGDITLDHVIPAAAAKLAPLPADLRPELVAALAARGVESLYCHQADAYNAVRNGRHLVVVTPTASGKTLCYNLPVLQRLLENPGRRALFVYPTKALAQDQLAELSMLKHGLPIDLRVDTYDGDTAPGRRTAIAPCVRCEPISGTNSATAFGRVTVPDPASWSCSITHCATGTLRTCRAMTESAPNARSSDCRGGCR